jgi:hypothetical protein
MADSFFSTLQRELLDEHRWTSRRQLALAVFERMEAWYNPHRRHSSIGDVSPIDLGINLRPRCRCGMITTTDPSGEPGQLTASYVPGVLVPDGRRWRAGRTVRP